MPKEHAEQATELTEKEAAELRPIDAPYIAATTFSMQVVQNQVVLVTCCRHRPVRSGAKRETRVVYTEDVGILSLTPQATKDLMLLLGQAVKHLEEVNGEIQTEYSKRAENAVRKAKGR